MSLISYQTYRPHFCPYCWKSICQKSLHHIPPKLFNLPDKLKRNCIIQIVDKTKNKKKYTPFLILNLECSSLPGYSMCEIFDVMLVSIELLCGPECEFVSDVAKIGFEVAVVGYWRNCRNNVTILFHELYPRKSIVKSVEYSQSSNGWRICRIQMVR